MNVSDGKISYDEPLETLANILEAIIDTILYGSTGVKTEKLSSFATTPLLYFIHSLVPPQHPFWKPS